MQSSPIRTAVILLAALIGLLFAVPNFLPKDTLDALPDWLPKQAMLSAIRRGDTIVTTGGIVGKVTKAVDGEDLEVEVSQGVKVKVVRGMIADVRSKSEPVNDNKPA